MNPAPVLLLPTVSAAILLPHRVLLQAPFVQEMVARPGAAMVEKYALKMEAQPTNTAATTVRTVMSATRLFLTVSATTVMESALQRDAALLITSLTVHAVALQLIRILKPSVIPILPQELSTLMMVSALFPQAVLTV
ncbi:MAG: hypothetical protein D6698_14440 [Gammaproteobacteria bacterium]|nr:MAG: hypothetical protein D6698_14440 [Gammaproteobacteria bacterium]